MKYSLLLLMLVSTMAGAQNLEHEFGNNYIWDSSTKTLAINTGGPPNNFGGAFYKYSDELAATLETRIAASPLSTVTIERDSDNKPVAFNLEANDFAGYSILMVITTIQYNENNQPTTGEGVYAGVFDSSGRFKIEAAPGLYYYVITRTDGNFSHGIRAERTIVHNDVVLIF